MIVVAYTCGGPPRQGRVSLKIPLAHKIAVTQPSTLFLFLRASEGEQREVFQPRGLFPGGLVVHASRELSREWCSGLFGISPMNS